MIRYLAAIACCLVTTSSVQAQKITQTGQRSADRKTITVEGTWDNEGTLFGMIRIWYKKKGDANYTLFVSPDVNFTNKTYKGEITGLDPNTGYFVQATLYYQKDTMSPVEEVAATEEEFAVPGGAWYHPRSFEVFWCRRVASPAWEPVGFM